MKQRIGFFIDNDNKTDDTEAAVFQKPARPVRSLVDIHFEKKGMILTYYNDRFDLHPGDMVFVSGKMAGMPGIVVSVNTRFRIHTADYQKVIALLDLTIHGSFTGLVDKMVSIGTLAVTPEQFSSWIIPPANQDEEPDVIISGDGYAIDIHHIEECPFLSEKIANRALDYCQDGRVKYIAVKDGIGCAFIEGTKWYRVDFSISKDGFLTELYCDCPYNGLCKHMAAVAYTLRALMQQEELDEETAFSAIDRSLFWRLISRRNTIEV